MRAPRRFLDDFLADFLDDFLALGDS